MKWSIRYLLGAALAAMAVLTLAVFAIWPVVADAPWEDTAAAPRPTQDHRQERIDRLCQGAIDARNAIAARGPSVTGTGRVLQSQYQAELQAAEAQIGQYC